MDWRDMWPGNDIHQSAIIDSSVVMGKGNIIGPFTVIGPDVILGDKNRIVGQASIGSPPEHKSFWSKHDNPGVQIGSNNVIREFTTINSGTVRNTMMWNNCTMLRGSHLSHDSILESETTLSCNVLVGGHSYIMQGANLGLGAIIHQYQVIGSYSMLGMGTIVPKSINILPGRIYVGNPAKELRLNIIGLDRSGVSVGNIQHLEDRFWELKRSIK